MLVENLLMSFERLHSQRVLIDILHKQQAIALKEFQRLDHILTGDSLIDIDKTMNCAAEILHRSAIETACRIKHRPVQQTSERQFIVGRCRRKPGRHISYVITELGKHLINLVRKQVRNTCGEFGMSRSRWASQSTAICPYSSYK